MSVRFCTAINCMDGRVQTPVIAYLQQRFDAENVDMITAPGPEGALARSSESSLAKALLRHVSISIEAHGSRRIAIAGHHDCAGNPAPDAERRRQLTECVDLLADRYPQCEVIALWVDSGWSVAEIAAADRG